MRMITCKK